MSLQEPFLLLVKKPKLSDSLVSEQLSINIDYLKNREGKGKIV